MKYICKDCEQECTPVEEDASMGTIEHFGQRGHHREMIIISDCCGSGIMDEFGDDADYLEWEADQEASEADYRNDCARDDALMRDFDNSFYIEDSTCHEIATKGSPDQYES